jgi:uncharacterized membrane protein YphA (DoxX/SURF4 family)
MQFTIATPRTTTGTTNRRNVLTRPATRLWTAQAVLAGLFIFAGVMKLVGPVDQAVEDTGLSVLFYHFIGVCELLGGVGLVLPQLTGIRRELTPLAAAGLVIIMAGAVVITAFNVPAVASIPFVVGLLAAYVAVGRGRQVLGRTQS